MSYIFSLFFLLFFFWTCCKITSIIWKQCTSIGISSYTSSLHKMLWQITSASCCLMLQRFGNIGELLMAQPVITMHKASVFIRKIVYAVTVCLEIWWVLFANLTTSFIVSKFVVVKDVTFAVGYLCYSNEWCISRRHLLWISFFFSFPTTLRVFHLS